MTDTPPGAYCGVDGCRREAVDRYHPIPRCPKHNPTVESEAEDSEPSKYRRVYREDVERALGVERDDPRGTDGDDENLNQHSGGETGGVLVNTDSGENRPPEPDSPDANPGENVDASRSSPGYSELYLEARDRADADGALVPDEDVRAVFDAHGWGDVVDALGGLSDWLVWTPDEREDPLYAYTPDLAGDTSGERDRLAELLEAAGVGTERFIDVLEGQKASFDTANAREPDDPEISGNYGVKGGRGGDDTGAWLVDIDVDDYDPEKAATDHVDELREDTLAVASAHTTRDRPGHLYVAVDGDPRAVAHDVLGREIDNPQASFGEIRVDQQYVVGPGSEIVCACDRCTDRDADDSMGRYELATATPPVVWSETEFREFLLSDPKIEAAAARADDREDATGEDSVGTAGTATGGLSGTLDGDADPRLQVAKAVDDYVAGALRDARNPDDRSEADAALARAVAPWLSYDESEIREVLDDHGTGKWATRTDDSYRDSVLGYAADRAVSAYDPLPYWALVEYAVAEDVVDEADLVERESDTGLVVDDPDDVDADTYRALPGAEAYNQTLDALEDLGVDHGRERADPSGHAPDADPVAALPFAALDALSPEERKRAVRKRGVEWPDTDDARDELRDAVFRELRAGNTTVLDAPTALGKTYAVATEPWRRRAGVTGESPVVHLHATTDARDEAAAETRGSSATRAVLKGRTERCPVAAGDHDPVDDPGAEDAPDVVVTVAGEPASAWFNTMCDEKGIPFSTAHALAREHNDQGRDALPCCDGEDADCPAVAQWDGLPRDDDGEPAVDVIHATHQFAYVPSLRAHTNVILDEQPDFTEDLSQDRIRRMVNAYLREIDAPATTWEHFVRLARANSMGGDVGARDDMTDLLEAHPRPDTEWYVDCPDAHALAPDLTRALWRAFRWEDSDANGRRSAKALHEPPRFDTGDGDGDGYGGTWLSVVVDDANTVQSVRNTPDFSQARAVVGLDAHPSMPMWQLNAAPGMTRDTVLDPAERRLWRRYERGLTVVQTGDATRPRSGPNAREWMNDERVRTVLDALADHYGDGFDTAITTDQVEPAVRRLLADAVDADREALADEQTLHYGQEKSRNPEPFADADAGYVYGCMDPGDDMILDALAELDLDATPARVSEDDVDDPDHAHCSDCNGAGCRDCHGTGRKRAKGRTFDGPDADTARAVLASVRENHVAQAAGRYARDPDADDSGAAVYVHTDAAPVGFVDVETPGVEWLATDLQREIIDALADRPTATTREIADAVDCTKEHVRETLARLEDEDLVARFDGAGDHGADVYRAESDTVGDAAADALADLGLDVVETTNDPLQDPSRWSLAICPGGRPDDAPTRGVSTTADADRATSGADPPPNPGD